MARHRRETSRTISPRRPHRKAWADGQQLWEALAVLVAIDLWPAHWQQQRIILKVRGDNVTGLTLLIKMRPPNSTIAIVALEFAMKLLGRSFPHDAEHTLGMAHVLADRLTRVYAPNGLGALSESLHPALASAQLSEAPVRSTGWYKV